MSSKATHVQTDGTVTCLLNLRTLFARFLFWINLPFCWLGILLTLTGHVEAWRSRMPADERFWISVACGIFGGWLVLSHTVGVFGAIAWELWWNPYVYHSGLRGKVRAEEEQQMLAANRNTAKRVFGDIFGDRPGTTQH